MAKISYNEVVFLQREGVPGDEAEAAQWYTKLAEYGEADAQIKLGLCYYNGKGVRQDKAKADHWFKKAANQGDGSWAHHIGLCFYNGEDVPVDKAAAVRWFKIAAEKGLAEAKEIFTKMSENVN